MQTIRHIDLNDTEVTFLRSLVENAPVVPPDTYILNKLAGFRYAPNLSTSPDSDPVNPPHYKGDYVMRIIEDFGLSFCLGNVVKYVLRAKEKNGIEDLKKGNYIHEYS